MKNAIAYLLVVATIPTWIAFAQLQSARNEPLTSLGRVLNPDGTINMSAGFSGSLDANGWRMRVGQGGQPVFTPASVPADSLWDDEFNLPDITNTGSSTVAGLASDGTNLYVVGTFVGAGRVRSNGVAKWDGSSWVSMGSGMDDPNGGVSAVAVSGGNVFVGGYFRAMDGVSANMIAKWNGTSWSALGSGTGNGVRAIAISGTDVYVGGYFSIAGGLPIRGIARWNGTRWDSLGRGVNGDVNAISVSGTDIYVGGSFTTAGGIPANHIARWNGTNWDSLGSGVDGVNAIAVVGTDIYVGGPYIAGGDTVHGIAKWNGTNWSSLGSGLGGYPLCLAMLGTDLYAGGVFTTAGGSPASNIAKWNGTSWSALPGGIGGPGGADRVNALAVLGNNVYAGGSFYAPTPTGEAHNVVRWSGTSWAPLHGTGVLLGLNGGVSAIAVGTDKIYVAGNFTIAGAVLANRIARWNGSAWSTLGTGTDGAVAALALKGDTLYAGGSFTTAGGVSANRVAMWNGSSWSALGSGLNSYVNALAVSGNDLYVGGQFTTAGGVSASRVAKWNGSGWSSLGSGLTSGFVKALAVIGTDLYAGGFFSYLNNIAKWDGSAWSTLGAGLPQGQYNIGVTSLAVGGSMLYAGGDFILSGGRNKIARWDGSAWSGLATGVSTMPIEAVYAVAVRGNDVFVCGLFNSVPGPQNIARWDGSVWSSLGSGTRYSTVYALGVNGGNLYAGGGFLLSGDKPANCFSRWFGPPVVAFQPPSGGVGSTVTITGGEFDLTPSNNTVRFGSTPAVASSATLNTLTVTVPAGATTAPISVTTRNLTGTSSASFVVTPTSVEQGSELLPKTFALSQNYPNPFNPSTTIKYQLPTQQHVTLKVYDLLGREVATLVDWPEAPGYKSVQFDAGRLAGGVYFYRIQAGNFVASKKLLILK